MSEQTCPNCGRIITDGESTCQYCGTSLTTGISNSGQLALTPGTLLHSRYEIQELIHAGSVYFVYLSHDKNLFDRRCIIKQVRERLSSDVKRLKLDAEVQRMTQFNHPGITAVIDHFVDNGYYFLVEEFVSGKTLRAVYDERQGQFSESEVVIWAMSICDILSYIHQEGINHRYINPDNIMLTDNGAIKFKSFNPLYDIENYTPGKMEGSGKFGFTPPEQWQGKPEPRSDIFALGATIFYLLTGFLPLSKEYLNGQGPQTVDYYPQFPPVRSLNSSITTRLEEVLRKALQISVDNRFSSAAEFQQALLSTAQETPPPAPAARKATPAVQPVAQPVARPVPVTRTSGNYSGVKLVAILLPVLCIIGLAIFLALDFLGPGSSSANTDGKTPGPTAVHPPVTTVPVASTAPPTTTPVASITASPTTPSSSGAVLLTTGVIRSEFKTAGEEHSYYFQGKAGDTISLTLADISGQLFVSLKLEDASGNEIRSAADTNIASINTQLTSDGTYFVTVKDDNNPLQTGPYSLAFDSVLSTQGSIITSASPVTGDLDAFGEAAYYWFRGKQGDLVYITLSDASNSIYPSLTLYDSRGVAEESVLDDRTAEIITRLKTNGDYKIRVSDGGSPPGTGQFTLSFNKVMDNKSIWIASGPALKGEFSSPGEVRYFSFNAKENDYISITLADASGPLNMDLTLFTLGGTEIASVSDSDIAEIITRLKSSGTYIVRVRDISSPLQAGSYTLSFNNFTDKKAELITYGANVAVDLSLPGEVKEFYFEGKKDEQLVITFSGMYSTTKVSIRLLYTDGSEIEVSSGHNNGIIRYKTPAVDAIHYIQVRDDSSPVQSGTYFLGITKTS
jgi:hypothetical protein